MLMTPRKYSDRLQATLVQALQDNTHVLPNSVGPNGGIAMAREDR